MRTKATRALAVLVYRMYTAKWARGERGLGSTSQPWSLPPIRKAQVEYSYFIILYRHSRTGYFSPTSFGKPLPRGRYGGNVSSI